MKHVSEQIAVAGLIENQMANEGSFNNKNENTSSSLGKRNYKEFQKTHQENKMNQHQSNLCISYHNNNENTADNQSKEDID